MNSILEQSPKNNEVSDKIIELLPPSDDEFDHEASSDGSNDGLNDNQVTNASFGNYKIHDKDDNFIGFCDHKRYKWYIRKGLANQIGDEVDKKIRINFEPNYKNDDERGSNDIENERLTICNVCGSKKNLRKFHVIPLQFKRYFPVAKKKHNVTDILLLCKSCSISANKVTDMFKQTLYAMLSVKPNDFIDPDKTAVKRLAIKIKKNRNHGKPYVSLIRTIHEQMGTTGEISIEQLEEYRNQNCKKSHEGCETIGEYVTHKFIEKNKIDYFSLKWKENFLVNMVPKHVPKDFTT